MNSTSESESGACNGSAYGKQSGVNARYYSCQCLEGVKESVGVQVTQCLFPFFRKRTRPRAHKFVLFFFLMLLIIVNMEGSQDPHLRNTLQVMLHVICGSSLYHMQRCNVNPRI